MTRRLKYTVGVITVIFVVASCLIGYRFWPRPSWHEILAEQISKNRTTSFYKALEFIQLDFPIGSDPQELIKYLRSVCFDTKDHTADLYLLNKDRTEIVANEDTNLRHIQAVFATKNPATGYHWYQFYEAILIELDDKRKIARYLEDRGGTPVDDEPPEFKRERLEKKVEKIAGPNIHDTAPKLAQFENISIDSSLKDVFLAVGIPNWEIEGYNAYVYHLPNYISVVVQTEPDHKLRYISYQKAMNSPVKMARTDKNAQIYLMEGHRGWLATFEGLWDILDHNKDQTPSQIENSTSASPIEGQL